MTGRLLIDAPASGAWNMAVDEAVLESAAFAGEFTWRFYRWSEPTLSLGYFQPYEDRRLHTASLACACVRRSSGGGAILHDRELTYSLAVPPACLKSLRAQGLYETVHISLIEALAQLGATGVSLAPPSATAASEPFLCFQRRAAGDVVLGPEKIAGSAQRRWRGAVLQHGSILLAASPAAPELAGLGSSISIGADDLIACWRRLLPDALKISIGDAPLAPAELQRATAISAAKYATPEWTARR